MADTTIHYIELVGPNRVALDKTSCGIPAPNGQVFGASGEALGATTLPHAATCTGCRIRANAVAQTEAAAKAAEDQKEKDAVEAEQLKAALAVVEAAKQKGVVS